MIMSPSEPIFLIWGAGGWIGGKLLALLQQQGKQAHGTTVRMHEQALVRETLDSIQPTHVINCAGKTGRPNVDWCEDNKLETIEANFLGTVMLAMECEKRGIHCTVMATGCIYTSTYTPNMSTLLSPPFKETDRPNFSGSFYSLTKAPAELVLSHIPNTCILRLRMPVSDDLSPRSFVTKILAYPRIVDIPNSHSMLTELLPLTIAMSEHRETGVYNFTNPGAISHNEVLGLYRDIVEPKTQWRNFTVEEQSKVIKAERSNCELDSGKLMDLVGRYQAEGCDVRVLPIREAYRECFERLKWNNNTKGGATLKGAWLEGSQMPTTA